MYLKDSALQPFLVHGVLFQRQAGNQSIADCPICGKAGHLYVNNTNGLWDCKSCGCKGNVRHFLEYIANLNAEELKGPSLSQLVEDRGISAETLKAWKVGWNGKRYTIPVYNAEEKLQDLRTYRIGHKTMTTTGMENGLLGVHKISQGPGKVYVCEGEWDLMALDSLAKKLDKEIEIVAVPGASVFKREWVPAFAGKEVIALYDNDEAGENGERLALERLSGTVKSFKFIHWPADAPDGFDVRDWVRYGLRIGKAQGCWKHLHILLEDRPRKLSCAEKMVADASGEGKAKASKTPIGPKATIEAYKQWLHFEEPEVLSVLFGSLFANRLEGEPIWLFLVAPPGGMKSELIMSLSGHPSIYATTSLTPHTLISGASWNNGKDPSLIPLLDRKVLAIKDFTTILTMHWSQRDEIFGTLRDAYDGQIAKNFGNGIRREYRSSFGILAGVTNKIETFAVMHQSLGERFLKFRFSDERRESEDQRILRALSNINREVAMRKELCEAAERCLARELPKRLPTIPDPILHRLVPLAQLTSRFRGVVDRDRFNQTVQYKPSYEVGTRLAKQLAKLAIGVAIFHEKDEVGEEEYRLIARVAMDTSPDRVELLVRKMHQEQELTKEPIRTSRVSEITRLPQATVFRVLQDLELLKVVDREGDGSKYFWKLHPKMEQLISKSQCYVPAPTLKTKSALRLQR